MSITARALVDQARIRHWSFTESQLGDGAAVLWLNQKQRTLLLRYREEVRGLVGTTVQAAGVINGSLVGLTNTGTPYFLDTVGDGFPLHFSDTGTPFIDTDDDPITTDPFGEHGGTPGYPLPADVIAILMIMVTTTNGARSPVVLVAETERVLSPQQSRYPTAFLSANRLVPVRPAPDASGDVWSSVTALTLSYIGLTTLATLDDPITLPAVMHEPLIAGLAALFAGQSRDCTMPERSMFSAAAMNAEKELAVTGFDIVGDMQTTHVQYKG